MKVDVQSVDKTKCTWITIDDGIMGFSDYEWRTSCGATYSYGTTSVGKYCPNCGKEVTTK